MFFSPLRYPGGKGSLTPFVSNLLFENNLSGTYCEPYAGGAGAALELLMRGRVEQIELNDADFHIYAFWRSILHDTEEFIATIRKTDITVEEWRRQKEVYNRPRSYSRFLVGFSTFFLNRCNRGGILPSAGPIGGFNQSGNFLIDARFPKEALIKRIEKIADFKDYIRVSNLDALDFLRRSMGRNNLESTLYYLDPPYYQQGQNLYLNFYKPSDHRSIRDSLYLLPNLKWMVSYDNVSEIYDLYEDYRRFAFDLNYSVQTSKIGKEIFIFSDSLRLPENFIIRKDTFPLIAV